MENRILNIAAYKFVNLTDLEALREKIYADLADYLLQGTILLAPEGINLMLAADVKTIEYVKIYLASHAQFSDLIYKDTYSTEMPFERFKIKIKSEIVPMGIENIKPDEFTGPTISPQQLKQWLDEDKDFVLLDTRNDYEIELGTFAKAVDYNIHNFRDFSVAADQIAETEKEKPVVMFCTGGIRCEKASPLLLKKGFKEVYQLEGGIINYFQKVGGEHYQGDCFVFDFRTAITPECKETGLTQCEQCQRFVTAEEQVQTQYKRGEHCIHCMPTTQAKTLEGQTQWA